jgi:hypothetical protein
MQPCHRPRNLTSQARTVRPPGHVRGPPSAPGLSTTQHFRLRTPIRCREDSFHLCLARQTPSCITPNIPLVRVCLSHATQWLTATHTWVVDFKQPRAATGSGQGHKHASGPEHTHVRVHAVHTRRQNDQPTDTTERHPSHQDARLTESQTQVAR